MVLMSCKKNNEPVKNIISIDALNDVTVALGTEFLNLPLPIQANVIYSDNTTEKVTVAFSQGLYSKTEAGTYPLDGVIILKNGTTNIKNLKVSVKVIVSPMKLKSVTQDGNLLYEYFYDTQNRLDHFKNYLSQTDYYYAYSSDNKVVQRLRKLAGKDYPEKYTYLSDGTLDKIDFFDGNNLYQTHTYTYLNGKISKYVNSDQTINFLKYRMFDYDMQGNISKITFDTGNPWIISYINDKKLASPLGLDLADPQNQTIHPIATFDFTILSSYTASFTYNSFNYPTQEIRTIVGNQNQTTFTYSYE